MKFLMMILGVALSLTSFSQSNINPPNGIQLTDTSFIDKTEIANIHWLEFLYYAEKDSSRNYYLEMLPDTSSYPSPNYLRSLPTRYYPLVGITYYQALEYCKWRSKVVGFNKAIEVRYRLPLKIEWELSIKQQFKKSKKSRPKLFDTRYGRGKMKYLIDNVSELSFEKGSALGGNHLEEHNIDYNYSKSIDPNRGYSWVGFRCIAIIYKD